MFYKFDFIHKLRISTLEYDISLPFETEVWSKITLTKVSLGFDLTSTYSLHNLPMRVGYNSG